MHIIDSQSSALEMPVCSHIGYGAQQAVSLASNFRTMLKY